MPIRPDNRKYYDARWRKFRLTALEAAGHRCSTAAVSTDC
jgi:hypothetical protein